MIMNTTIQGNIIKSVQPFIPHTYELLDQQDRAKITPEKNQEYVAWYNQVSDVAFYKIIYKSDNLNIVGFLAQPKSLESHKKYPVIIYNRGGNNDTGKNTVCILKDRFYDWVKAGYIVLASQYRGNDGSQGKDELGGADVHDVINLYKAIQSDIPYADLDHMYMVGYSRGAIMTYQALRTGIAIKAAAVIAGAANVVSIEELKPEIQKILEDMIPNWPTNRQEELLQRSVTYWADEIKVPVLLFHGDADPRSDISQSQNLAALFEKNKLKHELIIYPGGDHFLKPFAKDINKRIIEWFQANV